MHTALEASDYHEADAAAKRAGPEPILARTDELQSLGRHLALVKSEKPELVAGAGPRVQ